jgi:hypothetical protein
MDRNLGAMDTLNTSTYSARGLFYQFGRKDPFRPPVTTNNTQPAAATVVRPRTAIPHILKNPTIFYTGTFNNHNKEDGYLWLTSGGNKTAFDPCPEGYRVPQQQSSSIWAPFFVRTDTSIFFNGYYSTVLRYFPGAYISSGGLIITTGDAYYWTHHTASKGDVNAIGLRLYSSSQDNSANINKATGGYVRCVVDKNYILKKQGNVFGRYTADIIDDIQ